MSMDHIWGETRGFASTGARMAMWRIALILLGILTVASPLAAAPRVDDVRVGVHPGSTRFVLELSEAPQYRIFTLGDPYRVVIDLPELDWTIDMEDAPGGMGLVSGMRFGLYTPGTSRVVLDLSAPARVSAAFVLDPRDNFDYRLVLDIVPVTSAAFAQEASKPALESEEPLPAPGANEQVASVDSGFGDSRPTVVIDAGHGGVDPGAQGVSGIWEKDLVLDYAQKLSEALERTGRYRVVMTREEDIFLKLRDRVRIAQEAAGDLFVSLHANTHNSNDLRGASVYTLSENASDAEAAALAAKENQADVIAGVDLGGQSEEVAMILLDLAQRETMNLSKTLANTMVDELAERVALLRNTHRFAGFAVLKSPIVPSVLVEIGYMSNKAEEELLRSDAHQVKVTAALIDSIDRYFQLQQAFNQQ